MFFVFRVAKLPRHSHSYEVSGECVIRLFFRDLLPEPDAEKHSRDEEDKPSQKPKASRKAAAPSHHRATIAVITHH